VAEKATILFRRCLTRPPTAAESKALTAYYEKQHARFRNKELDPGKIAGTGSETGKGDITERAAWTVLARVLLNVDEAIVRR
jgi:hypothetical protein